MGLVLINVVVLKIVQCSGELQLVPRSKKCASCIGGYRVEEKGREERDMAELGSGWEVRESRGSGRTYYSNTYTGGTQWEKPAVPGKGQVAMIS